MSCEIEKCFENKTEIRQHNNLSNNLKVNFRRFRYKCDEKMCDNKAIGLDQENNKKFNQQNIKIERINDSVLFKMAKKNVKKNCTNNNKKQTELELKNYSNEICDSNDSIDEQQQYNCHYHHHFHNNNESTTSNHSNNNTFKENSECSNHQYNSGQASSMKSETLNDFEHCENSDEENIEEIKDDGSSFSDESDQESTDQSDQSSTTSSTSTLHNLHNLRTSSNNDEDNKSDKGNCCNCCYCEVFGHGIPTKAPTSRNFDEIRNRLRTRLKHKKSEHKSTGDNHTGDEIVTDHHNSTIIQNSKRNSHQSNLNQIKSNELNLKRDERDLDELLRFINANENENAKCEKKTKKKKDKKKKKNKIDQTNQTEDKVNNQMVNKTNCDKEQSTKQNLKKNDRLNVNSSAKLNNRSNSINGQVDSCNSKQLKDVRTLKEEKSIFVADQISLNSDKNNDKNLTFKSNKKQSNNKKSTTKIDKKVKQSDNSSNCQNYQNYQRANEKNLSKKSANSKDSLLDDVFLPRNIDYEDGSVVDEFEKELEEFKRFCFNSFAVPLPNKEKVNLDLKNIVIKKKPATSNFSHHRKNQPV